jgi:type IV secretory pathway TraG/TraD family ATPase VirD4
MKMANTDKQYTGMADSNDVLLIFVLTAAISLVALLIGGHWVAQNLFDVSLLSAVGNWWQTGVNLPTWASASLFVISAISAVLGILAAWAIGRGKAVETHIKGKFLAVGPALIAAIENPLIKRSGAGIKIGDLTLSKQRECRHMLFIGTPGSGKTVTLNSICKQIHARDERMIVHDPKGDYVQWFDPQTTAIFGPWDARTVIWDVAADLNSPALLQEAAAQWIPDSGGDNSIFSQGARQFLLGLLFSIFKDVEAGKKSGWGFRDLSEMLQKDPAEALQICFEGYGPARQTLGVDDKGKPTKTTLSMIQNCAAMLSWVHQLAAIEKPGVKKMSFVGWMKNPNSRIRNVILRNNMVYTSTASALFGTILTLMQNSMSALPEVKPSAPGVWFLIDEFPQIGKQSGRAIAALQEVGRSKGIRVITACQNLAQIYEIFDKNAGDALLEAQSCKVYMEMSPQAAEQVSQWSGKKLVNRHGYSVSKELSESYSATETAVLSPDDLKGLQPVKKGVEVIVQIMGQPVKLVVKYPSIDNTEPQEIQNKAFERGLLDVKPIVAAEAAETVAETEAEKPVEVVAETAVETDPVGIVESVDDIAEGFEFSFDSADFEAEFKKFVNGESEDKKAG